MEKTSRWNKQQSATDMAKSAWLERKETEAKQEAQANLSAMEQENNDIQDRLSMIRGAINYLRMWEINGWDNHHRADIIEMLRTVEGAMERYSTAMKKQLKRYKDGQEGD